MDYFIFDQLPSDFNAKIEVASCYLECNYKLLLVKRHPSKPQGCTWGVPAGKLEKRESSKQALIREVYEEIGIDIQNEVIEDMGKLFIRLPNIDYIYHMFFVQLGSWPTLHLALDEHEEARWVTYEEALELPLIKAGKEALDFLQNFKKYRNI